MLFDKVLKAIMIAMFLGLFALPVVTELVKM